MQLINQSSISNKFQQELVGSQLSKEVLKELLPELFSACHFMIFKFRLKI